MSMLFILLLSRAFAVEYFPTDYQSSRARFRASCAELTVDARDACHAFAVPAPSSRT